MSKCGAWRRRTIHNPAPATFQVRSRRDGPAASFLDFRGVAAHLMTP